MARIISQITFSDYGIIEILGDLERFLLALLGMNDEALMQRLEARRGNGRDDYPVRVKPDNSDEGVRTPDGSVVPP